MQYARTNDPDARREALVAEAYARGITGTLDSLKEVWSILDDIRDLCSASRELYDEHILRMRRLHGLFQLLHQMRGDQVELEDAAKALHMNPEELHEILSQLADFCKGQAADIGKEWQK
jgi:hypothetical protein